MTRRERALRIAEETLIRVHGEPMFWKNEDLADRQMLIRRCEADLARIDWAKPATAAVLAARTTTTTTGPGSDATDGGAR